MKRFFNFSLLFAFTVLILSSFAKETISVDSLEEAKEIHCLITDQIDTDMSIDLIYEAVNSQEAEEAAPCYHQGHLDRMIYDFGNCDPNWSYPSLDLNGDGCINTIDLLLLSSNWCG